ncbi:MAG: hypothetical protein ED557_07150 [Balneola sp.]|nr:MAG: hypothetical protein ED557_07150 [Balneola sp.]
MKKICLIAISFLFHLPQVAQAQHEDFTTFLEKFRQDEAFQKSRLVDSVRVVYATGDFLEQKNGHFLPEMDRLLVSKENWIFEALTFQENTIEEVELVEPKLIRFQIIGVDNGIFITCWFLSIQNKWHLKGYVDDST